MNFWSSWKQPPSIVLPCGHLRELILISNQLYDHLSMAIACESFNYYNLLDLITTLKLYRCLDLRKVTLQVYGVEKELITASWRCWLGCSGARHKSLICHLIGDWLPAVQSISLSAFWKNNISLTLLINTFVQDLYQETARMISFPDNSQLDKI